jgi:hypothetical protein
MKIPWTVTLGELRTIYKALLIARSSPLMPATDKRTAEKLIRFIHARS